MIILPLLTEKDMEVFKGKKVIIYGTKGLTVDLYKIFKHFGIDIIGCYNKNFDENRISKLKLNIKGIPLISRKRVEKILSDDSDIIVQISDYFPEAVGNIKRNMSDKNIECSPYSAGVLVSSFSYLISFSQYSNIFNYMRILYNWKKSCEYNMSDEYIKFLNSKPSSPIIICSTPKTGDHSFVYTFDAINKNSNQKTINYVNAWHRPKGINKNYCGYEFDKAKVIVGVREPIGQNISSLFQEISSGLIKSNWILGDLENKKYRERQKIVEYYYELCKNESENVQVLWKEFIKRYIYTENNVNENTLASYSIQQFLLDFSKYVLDITKYPFNKEKGYTIIKEGNMEVFVYQLEKLNNLVPELSEWVGVPFTELVRGNDASDKWIGDSYKQAQKEIEITQEYFDRCYNEPYVQHCYSEADIEKFKEKWRPHIKK